MWAQKFKDCFPRGEPEPDPNAHLDEPRVRVGHYMVPPELVEEYKARIATLIVYGQQNALALHRAELGKVVTP